MTDSELLFMLGKRIKKIRTEKRIKQNQLAVWCDFEKARMSRIESGKTNPTMLTLYKICYVLNVPVSELFEE